MLINSNELLRKGKLEKKAVFHFNINNLEWTRFILEEAERLNLSVIIGISESAVEYMGGYNVVYSIVSNLIKDLNIKTNVVLHLDHGKSFESCKKAVDAGFTSVMIDKSIEEFDINVSETKRVVEYAHKRNVSVEAEIGAMGSISSKGLNLGNKTNVSDCIEFVKRTNIDSLAAAVGTVHGIYKGELDIDYKLISEIASNLGIPLVLHGGSGLDNSILKKCVESGITKININSDLQQAWSLGVREFLNNNKDVIDPRKIIGS